MVAGPRHRQRIGSGSVCRKAHRPIAGLRADKGVAIRDIAINSHADFTPDKINLTDLDVSAPDGRFHGAAKLNELKRVSVKGQISGVTIAEVGRMAARGNRVFERDAQRPGAIGWAGYAFGTRRSQRQRQSWI